MTDNNAPQKQPAIVEQYKGRPILKIPVDLEKNWYMRIGIRKSRAILDHLDEIRAFVEQHETGKH
jgi:hypothetical protein